MNNDTIGTCSNSLMAPGFCCVLDCRKQATVATLASTAGEISELGYLTEHTRCEEHAHFDAVATKPLVWDGVWGP